MIFILTPVVSGIWLSLLNFQVHMLYPIHGQVNLRSTINIINNRSGNETTAATPPTEKNDVTTVYVSNKQSFRRHNGRQQTTLLVHNIKMRSSYFCFTIYLGFFSFLSWFYIKQAAQYLSSYFFLTFIIFVLLCMHAYLFIMHLNSAPSSFNLWDAARPWTGK